MNHDAPAHVPPVTVRTPGDAPSLELMGMRIRFLVSAEETAGAWSLIEYTAPPRFAGPAPHYHANTTELFYVLEGQLTVDAAGEVRVLGPGDLALVQPGCVTPLLQRERSTLSLSGPGFSRGAGKLLSSRGPVDQGRTELATRRHAPGGGAGAALRHLHAALMGMKGTPNKASSQFLRGCPSTQLSATIYRVSR